MKKTRTILSIGLALISFNAFGQGLFQDPGSTQENVTHELRREDNEFLYDIEEMQKNIRLMQLELKEKELVYKVHEQNQKLDELVNPKKEEDESCEVAAPVINEASLLDRFIPIAETPVIEEDSVMDMISVTSIKGMEGKLKATVNSENLGTSIVSEGDVLNNGYMVKKISQNTVTFENTDGDLEVIGLTFKR